MMINIFKDGFVIEFCKNQFTECYIFHSWQFYYFQIIGVLVLILFVFLCRFFYKKLIKNSEVNYGKS
jgi:hypothetical protein